MDWIQAMILGIIQGLTEFLPISSTGHLYLGRNLFGLNEAGLFLDTMLHLGTLIAVCLIYREEIVTVIKNPFGHLSLVVIAGTLPTVVIALLFEDFFEKLSETGATLGWEFLVTGAILWFADSVKNLGNKKLDDITFTDALLIGTFQGAAILPAISRSGITIAAALFRGIDKSTAAYFSFFLSIPAIAGAIFFQSTKLVSGTIESVSVEMLIIATLASGICGYIAVKWMISILKRGSLKIFSYYVWAVGVVILLGQFTGRF
ncbi:undecaprenyl-diphosphate phosphatase [Pseudalkalibacillus caeni]|uniref:Undecaprenyl-diphosphatase n=1 Tax=Exobacillus caeni TaxID=2574798 RepID=A0A5R9F5X1_9BACL|nr:undecaprenyl-diphosphate phosphatase [Pseudalkalibacillus caeni]TLS37889.1 undecaprenyl-diphosphate phosphatase [Pseudalkalibacillus caeni]